MGTVIQRLQSLASESGLLPHKLSSPPLTLPRIVSISCFEVFLNCVNDLLLTDHDRSLYVDKIKSVPVASYSESVLLLSQALKNRKVFE